MTWVGEFRPGNKTIYAVFDEESDFQVKNKHCLCTEGKNKEKQVFQHLFVNLFVFYVFSIRSWGELNRTVSSALSWMQTSRSGN